MPVKVLQKIRDQAILLGPRPPQTGDRHVLVAVVHDDPMIVRLHPHFTPLLIVSLKTRVMEKFHVFNESSKNRRHHSSHEFSCKIFFLAE